MMFKKWKSILIAAILSLGFAMTAFGETNLEERAEKQNVESIIKTIRGMYEKTNSGAYTHKKNQWLRFYDDSSNVVKAVVSNGDLGLDRVMKLNGYKSYEIEYYYDNPDYNDQFVSGNEGPNFAFALIDGKEYRYYFSGEFMIRRIGPDGVVQDNPLTNDFMNQVYKTGCFFQNDFSQCTDRNLNQETIYFSNQYYNRDSQLSLYAMIFKGREAEGKTEYGLYIVDTNTKLSSSIQEEKTWRAGDNGYSWLNRHLNTDQNDGGYFGSLECFMVTTTGNHVDEIQGIYATH